MLLQLSSLANRWKQLAERRSRLPWRPYGDGQRKGERTGAGKCFPQRFDFLEELPWTLFAMWPVFFHWSFGHNFCNSYLVLPLGPFANPSSHHPNPFPIDLFSISWNFVRLFWSLLGVCWFFLRRWLNWNLTRVSNSSSCPLFQEFPPISFRFSFRFSSPST